MAVQNKFPVPLYVVSLGGKGKVCLKDVVYMHLISGYFFFLSKHRLIIIFFFYKLYFVQKSVESILNLDGAKFVVSAEKITHLFEKQILLGKLA